MVSLCFTVQEKHASKPKATLDSYFTDKKTHLYTLGLYDFSALTIKCDCAVTMHLKLE